jgi:hypothetical protein
MINILQCEWPYKTNTIYVLGTGPKGLPHYHRIPKDAVVIGVNKAIQIWEASDIPMAVWLCADGTLPEQKWFTSRVLCMIRSNHELADRQRPTVCFSTGVLVDKYPNVPYYFNHGKTLREPPKYKPVEGVLRAGGNIGMQAVQLAYWKGAKRIVLCGFDMEGGTYFDGSHNINPRLSPDGSSLHLRLAQCLCTILAMHGVKVESISPTKLDIPTVAK